MNDDKTTTDLIIKLLEELRDDVKKINGELVGTVKCDNFRKELGTRIDKVEARVDKFDIRMEHAESICNTFEAVKPGFVDVAKLSEAKQEAITISTSENDDRLTRIEDNIKSIQLDIQGAKTIAGVVKENKSALIYLVALMIGVYSGRIKDVFDLIESMGPRTAAIDISILILTAISLGGVIWGLMNMNKLKNRVMLFFS
jgi:hypothetical protein